MMREKKNRENDRKIENNKKRKCRKRLKDQCRGKEKFKNSEDLIKKNTFFYFQINISFVNVNEVTCGCS